jgi:hypothetical protein
LIHLFSLTRKVHFPQTCSDKLTDCDETFSSNVFIEALIVI